MHWYKSFQLKSLSRKKIHKVSGGEQQKTYLSRIMSINSEVIFLDEPNQNLDIPSNQKLMKLILDEKKKNKTIIFASHDIEFVKNVSDKLIVLDCGNVIFNGLSKKYFKI